MTTWDKRSLIEDALANGVDDWVYAAWIAGIAGRVVSDPDVVRHVSLGLIAELLLNGWMVAGDVTDVGHVPWEISTAAAIERITREWMTIGDAQLYPGQIVWLANTERGNELGQAVLDREVGQ
jgi:hypothetical protein